MTKVDPKQLHWAVYETRQLFLKYHGPKVFLDTNGQLRTYSATEAAKEFLERYPVEGLTSERLARHALRKVSVSLLDNHLADSLGHYIAARHHARLYEENCRTGRPN